MSAMNAAAIATTGWEHFYRRAAHGADGEWAA